MISRRRVTVVGASIAALSIAGGVAAQFTASTESAPQYIGTGTVSLSLADVGDTVWTMPIDNLAAGDTLNRFVDLTNTGSIDIDGVQVAQSNNLGSLLVGTADVDISLTECPVAWNTLTGVCAGTQTVVLNAQSIKSWDASGPRLEDRYQELQSGSYADFSANSISHLRVSTHVAEQAGNEIQGRSGTITYVFKAAQRGPS